MPGYLSFVIVANGTDQIYPPWLYSSRVKTQLSGLGDGGVSVRIGAFAPDVAQAAFGSG